MDYPSVTILMTATCRWQVIKRTLDSFSENLFKDYPGAIRLVTNLDPIGVDDQEATSNLILDHPFVETKVREFNGILGASCAINMPDDPSFPEAYKYLWTLRIYEPSFATPFVFMLEDDWELTQKVNLMHMIDIMERFPNLATLRLPFRSTDDFTMKNWKFLFPWNQYYFECPSHLKREVGYCGHPSLIRGDFVSQIAPHINPNFNPEKQFHHGSKEMMAVVDHWEYGVYGKPNQPAYIHDIGRTWMVENGFCKNGNKAWFTKWSKE